MKRKAAQPVENLENRDNVRMEHTSTVQVQDLESGKIHKARMFNYSKEGVYFESDSVLNKGMQIYIGIQNSPFASLPDVLEYHRGKIMWRKKLKRSFFRFGYGVKLASASDKQNVKTDGEKTIDSRKHPRRQYNQSTMFATQNGIFEGSIKNISSSGVFLTSESSLEVGQILTLVLPFKNGKEVKAKGEIVWMNDNGFGIKFLSVDKKSSPSRKK
jgi:hypothetical protein